jgi:hypothetical protein
MRRSTWCKGFASIASLIALTTFPTRAFADVAAAFDLDYAAPIKVDAVSSGWGFGIRLGNRMHVPMLVATPEVGFTYHAFGGDAAPKMYRGIGGLRLGIGEMIRPGIFGHVGYGWRKVDLAGQSDTSSSFTYDFGAFLDFTLLPTMNIGVHGAYNQWTGGSQPSFQFATLGAHAALIF